MGVRNGGRNAKGKKTMNVRPAAGKTAISLSDLMQVQENLALIQGYLESAGVEPHICKARIEATKARSRIGSAIKRLGLTVEVNEAA